MMGGYLFVGTIKMGPILIMIAGVIVSTLVAYILHFSILSLNYSHTEYTQFEDDDYYYYVKAVPKVKVTAQEVNVKRINVQKPKKR
jgi:mannitol-specific phosphotransferase system IIBC component